MAHAAHEQEHVEPAHPRTTAPTTAARTGWGTVGLIVRILLTIAGAGGLIIGAFLDWFQGTTGVDLDIRTFWQTTFDRQSSTFIETVGFVMIVLGLLASSGWLRGPAGSPGSPGLWPSRGSSCS
jgi:hypothetical protein